MSCWRFKHLSSFIFFLFFFQGVKAQGGLCPNNLDFEAGDFTDWTCRSGFVSNSGGVNTYNWTSTGEVPGQHTIISSATAGTDPYGQFPELCPNGSNFSVKLGNTNAPPGRQAIGISYTYTIPATATVFSIFYHYAVVLQNPAHIAEEQPRFRARIIDLSTNQPIPCVTFDFTASSSLPGFVPSRADPNVLYKDWTPVTLNLSGYAGRTIELEFITTDCTRGGHFGYAYMDVNTACNGAISGTTICQGDNAITLNAPFGFQSYAWYSDNTFSTVLATTQSLYLNPPPAVGTIFPVIVTPFPGFGCRDTLYATISVANKPISVAGPDIGGCVQQQVQLGGPGTTGYQYLWTPAAQVSNATISNPTGWAIPPNPTEFIVRTTDLLTGCFSYDTAILANIFVDTAVQVSGNLAICTGAQPPVLTVNRASAPVQWYDGANPIPGATSLSIQPAVAGNYWAELTQQGCIDSSSLFVVTTQPRPVANFAPDEDTLCITNNSFLFRNASSVSNNSPMTYNWKFSDGSASQLTDAVKTFSASGMYNAELVTTTAFGCKDSIDKDVYVMPNGMPAFSWDSVCLNRPVLFRNLSNENGAAQTNYSWTFNNGGPGSVLKNPLPVTYTTAGVIDVSLQLTALGCESDPQTMTKQVWANAAAAGIRYAGSTVPLGSSKFIHIRDSIANNYNWKPRIQLSNYNERYTEFFATGNDIEYLIEMTDIHTCVTTDTILMRVLKKPGYYLPTAFTPNGDGLNDVVRPYLVGMQSLQRFSVFNRWGNLIFSTNREGEGWDGKLKGLTQDSGVYAWILEFINAAGNKVTEKGTITIIR